MLSHYRNNNCKKIKKYYKLRLKNVFILEVHIFVPLSLVQLNKKKNLYKWKDIVMANEL